MAPRSATLIPRAIRITGDVPAAALFQLFGQGLVGGQGGLAGQGIGQHSERWGAGQLAVVADEELVEVVFLVVCGVAFRDRKRLLAEA